MGGDYGPHCIVPASLDCLLEFPSLRLALVGCPDQIEQAIASHARADRARVHVVAASQVVGMSESPSQALRGKPDSSMRVALGLVRDGAAHACVSAGNTGALMALARHVLKTLPGIDRPAMAVAIPTERGPCLLLDLGANVDCSAINLYQFAVMGSLAAESVGVVRPRVALLNVGAEEIKGNQVVKQAAALLQSSDLNYTGFVEGDGLFQGEADVAVCDGFVGNVLLKSSEGMARMVMRRGERVFRRSWYSRLVGALALPLLRDLRAELMPSQYNGAAFLGLQGLVVKSHGSAGRDGFSAAIRNTLRGIEEDLPRRLSERLHPLP